jgi:hypothetical protein
VCACVCGALARADARLRLLAVCVCVCVHVRVPVAVGPVRRTHAPHSTIHTTHPALPSKLNPPRLHSNPGGSRLSANYDSPAAVLFVDWGRGSPVRAPPGFDVAAFEARPEPSDAALKAKIAGVCVCGCVCV